MSELNFKNSFKQKQRQKRVRKLFAWLRNLKPIQREKVLCLLAIGFKRYAAQFINGLIDKER
jgi:transposase